MTTSSLPAASILDWGATQIAREISTGNVSSRDVTRAFIERIEAVDGQLNTVIVRRFEEALQEAAEADERQARGEELGQLHGVPLTVKDCFHLAGTTATIGLSARRKLVSEEDGVLVRRLRAAGGVCLGKTNVPQLMLLHECDNPVYGRTNNPWNVSRTCGGSTGGEAAIIAARGSPLGLGNDLGGSIRIPSHFCGIHGLKPTSRRLPREGTVANFRGMTSLQTQPGPLARRVEDLELALHVLVTPLAGETLTDLPPVPLSPSRDVVLNKLRVGYWDHDGMFPASAAIRRVVGEAADALRAGGAEVVEVKPPHVHELIDGYLGLMAADGGADPRRLVQGSEVDWRVGRMLWLESLSAISRGVIVTGLKTSGQPTLARLVSLARPQSADGERRIAWRVAQLTQQFLAWMSRESLSAFLCPPHSVPAPPHKFAIDLVAAASYAFLPNVLGLPAGTVSLSRVRDDEQAGRPHARDMAYHRAQQTDERSAGLPVGVQVVAGPWREDVVLAVMRSLEESFSTRADYPLQTVVPAAETKS
jgi:fatty acid amide hydrolase